MEAFDLYPIAQINDAIGQTLDEIDYDKDSYTLDIKQFYKSTAFLVFNSIMLFVTILRFFVLSVYIREAYLYVKLLGKVADKYTIRMFNCFTVSAVTIILYRIILIAEELALMRDANLGKWQHFTKFSQEILKNVGWAFQNTSFLLNIYRWTLILVPQLTRRASTASQDSESSLTDNSALPSMKPYTNALVLLTAFFFLMGFTNTILDLTQPANQFFYPYQCIMVNPFFICCYIFIYRALKQYHQQLLTKYEVNFTEEEKLEISKSNKEVFKFFFFKCQLMINYTIFGLIRTVIVDILYPNSLWAHILLQFFNMAVNISFIIMYLGIRDSVKKALQTQMHTERINQKKSKSKQKSDPSSHNYESAGNQPSTGFIMSQELAQNDLMQEYEQLYKEYQSDDSLGIVKVQVSNDIQLKINEQDGWFSYQSVK